MLGRRWRLKKSPDQLREAFMREFGVSPLLAHMMCVRGIADREGARVFLQGDISDLGDPARISGMEAAAERIERAAEQGEKALIFGDYDVDGVTSATIITHLLNCMGIECDARFPHRVTEGYGFNLEGVKAAREAGCSLIVVVDTGTMDTDPIEAAKQAGIDCVVLDHHLASEGFSDPCVLVNPHDPRASDQPVELCAAGVCYNLARLMKMRNPIRLDLDLLLQLAAVGTIADVSSMTGENRVITRVGLRMLERTDSLGLWALKQVAGVQGKLKGTHIGFGIGPRINAAGRMLSARAAYDLLLETDRFTALEMAQQLDKLNQRRRKEEKALVERIIADHRAEPGMLGEHAIVVAGAGWHKGLIGIVASRVSREFNRPAVVISVDEGLGTGSARSIEGIDLHSYLARCESLTGFGGHAMAAGVKLEQARLEDFRRELNTLIEKEVDPEVFEGEIEVDGRVNLDALSIRMFEDLDELRPFGPGNSRPVFAATGVSLLERPEILKQKHMRLSFGLPGNRDIRVRGLWWDRADLADLLAERPRNMAILFTPELDEWRGDRRVSLHMIDARLDGEV